MKSFHRGMLPFLFMLGFSLIILAGCAAPQISEGQIKIGVTADEKTVQVEVPSGSTADEALKAAGIVLGTLDRTDPPLYTVLGDGSQVQVTRVKEEFSVEQEVIPYESQILRNESLPAGQEYWLQLGENGLREITIRRVYENGKEVSNGPVKSVIVKDPVPQIKMVGVQKPFAPLGIPGILAYLADGNAWVMEGTTGNRRQLVTSGDLDGRVFSLSPDGKWLLYTRLSEDKTQINTLWVAPVAEEAGEPIDLQVANVVHFSEWQPGQEMTVAYSTVEPRPGPPGWQANNDLQMLTFSPSGFVRKLPPVLDTNSGGLYGWWGTTFTWAPDGTRLAYARPDEIGLVDLETKSQTFLQKFSPIQTFGDWAWVPGVGWSPGGDLLYGVDHLPPAESQDFDLSAIDPATGNSLGVVSDVGMFAYPVPSPLMALPSGESAFQLAYLQAIFPSQSQTSRYRLAVMDRDGSNRRLIFPEEGAGGLEPQKVVWSPQPLEEGGEHAIAVINQGNLWLVDSSTGEAWQITGDGLTSRIDWK